MTKSLEQREMVTVMSQMETKARVNHHEDDVHDHDP